MKNMNNKIILRWFLIINITSFLIAILDPILWILVYKVTEGGFPIFTMFSLFIGLILGLIYLIFKLFTSKDKKTILILLLVNIFSFVMPIVSLGGAILGIMIGFFIVYFVILVTKLIHLI